MEVINALLIPAMKGEEQALGMEFFFEWRDQIKAIEDTTLSAKLDAVIDSEGSDWAVESFFVYLFESTAKALE